MFKMNKKILYASGIILVVLIGFFVFGGGNDSSMNSGVKAILYKSPTCGCCSIYAQYLNKKGIKLEIKEMNDVSPIKEKYSVPGSMLSCHTLVIGNYFVEGHVPTEAIDKLLNEKPDIKGIGMGGMPSGSPGMPGAKKGPFIISQLGKDDMVSTFMEM